MQARTLFFALVFPAICFSQPSWEVRSANLPYLTDIQFQTAIRGFVTGLNGFLAYTDDGAATWTSCSYPSAFAEADFWGVSFPSPTLGFAACIIGDGERSAIMRSTDGGKNWVPVIDSSYYIWRPVFPTPTTGYVLMSDFKSFSAILRTTDAGDTWKEVGYTEDGYYVDIAMTDSVNGLALRCPDWVNTGKRFIDRTSDGFTLVTSSDISSLNFGNQMFLFSLTEHTYLTGYGGVEMTTDDGNTWKETFPEFYDYSNEVQYVSFPPYPAQVGFAVSSDPNSHWSGSTALMYVSTNRGRSWQQIHYELVRYYGPISSPQEYTAYVVMYYDSLRQSMVVRTKDGFGITSTVSAMESHRSLHVWPNPTESVVHLFFKPSLQRRLLQIEDIIGRVVSTYELAPGESTKDITPIHGVMIARIGNESCKIVSP